jgi:mono/diheme cytochrome c family protein
MKPVSQERYRKTRSRGKRSDTMTSGLRAAAVVLLAAFIAGSACAQSPGADTYKTKCAMCHGADGLAATPAAKSLKVISLKAPEKIKASDAQFIDATKNGKDRMPAYKDKLTDAQITDVIKYIRTLQK